MGGEVLEEQLPRARRRVLDAGIVPGSAGLPSRKEPGREEARRGTLAGRPVDLGHVPPHEDAVVAPGALLQVLTHRLVLRLLVERSDQEREPGGDGRDPCRQGDRALHRAPARSHQDARGDEHEGRQELQVVVAEEAETDRDRQDGRQEPEPEVRVAAALGAAFAPRAREVPHDRQVHHREGRRHEDERQQDQAPEPADAEVAAVADRRPEEQLTGADEERDDCQRQRETAECVGRAAPASLPPHEVEHREERRGARLFCKRGERDGGAGRERAAATREEHRRRHARQHEDLEVRRLPVLRCERDRREHHQRARDPRGAVAVASSSLEREEQRGERDSGHCHHAH